MGLTKRNLKHVKDRAGEPGRRQSDPNVRGSECCSTWTKLTTSQPSDSPLSVCASVISHQPRQWTDSFHIAGQNEWPHHRSSHPDPGQPQASPCDIKPRNTRFCSSGWPKAACADVEPSWPSSLSCCCFQPPRCGPKHQQVSLGNSTVVLAGPWGFTWRQHFLSATRI
jgi:hypothetical protein